MKYIYRIHDKKHLTNLSSTSKSMCLNNFLKEAVNENITVIADNCTPDMVNYLKNQSFEKVIETSLGNSKSFLAALDIAIAIEDEQEAVYLVEDDYLHKPGWHGVLNDGLEIAEFVTLYDHKDKYGTDSPNPLVQHGGELTRILLGNKCHWKETNSTTMTFATKVKTLKNYYDIIIKYLDKEIPDDYPMWREILFNSRLISPIPGYSTHCHEPWITPFFFRT